LNTLESLSSCLNLNEAKGKCPLCLEFEIKTDRQYDSHVGAHLEQLALFVLPQSAEMDTDKEEEEDGVADDTSVSDGESEHDLLHGGRNPNEWQDIEDDGIEARKVMIREQAAEAAAAAANDAAEKAQEEAEEAFDEALKEAEAKAKSKVAEAAKKAAATVPPPEKKAPIRFKDAIGRNYNFPWERCHRWRVSQYHLHLRSPNTHTF
jgi:hypothetical protein